MSFFDSLLSGTGCQISGEATTNPFLDALDLGVQHVFEAPTVSGDGGFEECVAAPGSSWEVPT
ncbi:hypothetical protein EON64_07095 [archaeon]|nr:MAG: hypothetical protein EON64_07095 [archaeon]